MTKNLWGLQIQSIIAQEGLSNSDVIAEITLNQTEDGQTVAVVSEAPSQVHLDGHHSAHSVSQLRSARHLSIK